MVEVVYGYAELDGTGLVFYDELLEQVALQVGGYYSASDYHAVTFGIEQYGGVVVLAAFTPVFCLQVGDGGIYLHRSHRLYHRGHFKVIVTGGKVPAVAKVRPCISVISSLYFIVFRL